MTTARRVSGRIMVAMVYAVILLGCGRLVELPYQPLTTPQQWCEQRPCIDVGGVVFTEPLGSVLVFLLAALWTGAGISLLRTRSGQRSRHWLGIALLLGGGGAAQAGISYQAFSYELKCVGYEHCRLTNGFEVGYSLTQALSVSAMLVAVAYACTTGRGRRAVIVYAWLNALLYAVVSIAGLLLPSARLLSFEVLMLFALPGILLVILLAARRLRTTRQRADRSLLIAAILLLVVQAIFFAYAAAGVTAALWRKGEGVYFSENDVLHAGMIAWLIYLQYTVGRELGDYEARSTNHDPRLDGPRDCLRGVDERYITR